MDLGENGLQDNEHKNLSPSEKRPADKLGKTQKPSKIQKRASTDKRCTSCGTTSTPVWRWGGEAKEVLLCNACSLRIRRSATRPQRAKSPADLASHKQSPLNASDDSGSPQTDKAVGELGPADAEALRVELLRCVEFHLGLEKARLLGPRDAVSPTDDWQNSQRSRDPFSSISHPRQGMAPNQIENGYNPQLHSGQPAYSMSEPLRIDRSGPYAANDARHAHMT